MSPIYEDMKQWVVDRQAANVRLEQAATVEQKMAQERYCEWLDDQRPDWLNEIERPEDAA
jgi:hypothetical protein